LIVGMGIGQVSHCQAQPIGLKQGASDWRHHLATPMLCRWSSRLWYSHICAKKGR